MIVSLLTLLSFLSLSFLLYLSLWIFTYLNAWVQPTTLTPWNNFPTLEWRPQWKHGRGRHWSDCQQLKGHGARRAPPANRMHLSRVSLLVPRSGRVCACCVWTISAFLCWHMARILRHCYMIYKLSPSTTTFVLYNVSISIDTKDISIDYNWFISDIT